MLLKINISWGYWILFSRPVLISEQVSSPFLNPPKSEWSKGSQLIVCFDKTAHWGNHDVYISCEYSSLPKNSNWSLHCLSHIPVNIQILWLRASFEWHRHNHDRQIYVYHVERKVVGIPVYNSRDWPWWWSLSLLHLNLGWVRAH